METRTGNDVGIIYVNSHLEELRREAHDDSLAHEAHRRHRTGRLPRSVGHALIFIGRVIAAEPGC